MAMSEISSIKPNFSKYQDGLVPAIVQDAINGQVLMLGYISEEAWDKTLDTQLVTFFSRSKQRLWTKGEESGNFLKLKEWYLDCDQDALLLKVHPHGPTCHTGATSCFGTVEEDKFLYRLEEIIADKIEDKNLELSYTARLVSKGIHKVAQKVGEEAVEVVIEALRQNDDLLLEETADLIYHLLVLLKAKYLNLSEVEGILAKRHQNRS